MTALDADSLIILIDDTRTFRAPVSHVRCRTSAEGLAALSLLRTYPGSELWLDHDLGMVGGVEDRVMPVVDELARAAFDGDPYPVSQIFVHTSNPEGSTIMRVLGRWDYPAKRVVAGDYLVEEALRDAIDADASASPAITVPAARPGTDATISSDPGSCSSPAPGPGASPDASHSGAPTRAVPNSDR